MGHMETTYTSQYAWSARCDCYNKHNSNSGRCTNRGHNSDGITDKDRKPGEAAICEECKKECREEHNG